MKILSQRSIYFFSFLVTIVLLGIAFYLQEFDGINPCPLCILQRIDMVILGILFFFGAILSLKKCGKILIGSLSTLVSIAGVFLSGRQVWLQHLPANQNADCGVTLQYLMHVLPFDQVMKKIMQGTAECSQTGGAFLHLTLAEWSLLCFVVFLIVSLVQLFRR